jgi:hypothetical protein
MELSNETLTILMEDTRKDLGTIKDDMRLMRTEMQDFIKCADSKYASKITEKIVYSMVGAICLAVLGGLLSLIMK